jgi:hypothetical protein
MENMELQKMIDRCKVESLKEGEKSMKMIVATLMNCEVIKDQTSARLLSQWLDGRLSFLLNHCNRIEFLA